MQDQAATILVVDDQPANLKVLFSLFKQQDFTVRIAESGELALKRQKLKLEEALAEVKRLSGFLSICSFCKKNS